MFQNLQDGLNSAFKSLRGKGKLTDSNMRDGLNLIEQSLLEADVSYAVVKDFMTGVSEQAMGEKVLKSLNPSDQLVGIVHQALIEFLGPVDESLHLKKKVNVLMLCGLQGSGKTTTCGKLSRLLLNSNIKPMLVAADLQRPAAIDQLHVLGEQLGVPVYSDRECKDPVKVCQAAVKKAEEEEAQVVILDTAGRLAIDEELMDELRRIDNRVGPDQVYFVVDGMTGQDAVNSASAFNEALELDGVIMTKLDGDARGGALLSVKHVTGVPIKFIGTGEHLDSLEPFRPDGMAGRILGHGDIVELVRQTQEIVDHEEQAQLEEKLKKGEFTLDDFRSQLEKMAKPGLMMKMMGLMPGAGELKEMMQNEDAEKDAKRLMGIIDSMTPNERRNPKIIEPSRRMRIANGAGVQPQQVNELVKQYETMKPIVTGMGGKGMKERLKMVQEMQESGMMNPGARGPKTKLSTGKRMTPDQKRRAKKERDKELRKKRRKGR
jgi:signal recognition particle subunit SRP54